MIKKIKTITGTLPPPGTDLLCPRCDWLYKRLLTDESCPRCENIHVNLALSFIELIK